MAGEERLQTEAEASPDTGGTRSAPKRDPRRAPAGDAERGPEGESTKAQAAFDVYRDLGPDRSLRLAALRLGKSERLLKRWSARHRWREKVAAWDRHQREREHEVARLASDASRERRAANAAHLERVAMAALRSLMVKDPETGEVRFDKRLSPSEIAALLRVACRLWPTEPAQASDSDAGTPEIEELGRLSRQDVDALLAMLERREEETTDEPDERESRLQ